ncbi:MAG: efflux RND transporter periplasmic adaptor subunit [Chlorobi bacterium]|nr:efflux RND transporter periplasmic adaptor subunit [Chlorobiota bacterium]
MKLNLKKREIIISSVAIAAGIILGWVFFGGNSAPVENHEGHELKKEIVNGKEVWTCSMHPQIRMDKPGKCPICGMTLIPVEGGGEEELSISEIKMSETAMKIAQVQTVIIEKKAPYKEVYFPGKIKADERNISKLTARFGGRIEKLFVNFTGEKVVKGQKLASIYSPDLVTAQKELFEAMKYKEDNPTFYKASRNKLKLWDLTEKQINEIETSGEPQFYFDVVSPITGTITMRHVALGDYVKEGDQLFEVINLNHLWVMFDAYESDIPWVKLGDKINFTVKSMPSKDFSSIVTFIDPVVDPKRRVAYVRTELDNTKGLLKPGMFTSGILKTMLPGIKNAITVPKSAILWTGKRAVVYVKVPGKEMVFEHREIKLGEDAGDYYIVTQGLKENEEVAANGVFKIDAAAQLLSKQSMMSPAGGGPAGGMAGMPGMDMGGDKKKSTSMNTPEKKTSSSKISDKFKTQFASSFKVYLTMKDAFIATDSKLVAKTAKNLKVALQEINMKLLKGNTHIMWMNQVEALNKNLDKMIGSKDIEEQRAAFANYNLTFYKSIKMFGVENLTTYYQYCPMAIGEKGAYWFSETKEIFNPYFGEAMMKCGETREEFK